MLTERIERTMIEILVDGKWTELRERVDYAPGEHPDSPIRNDIPAREWRTAHGSRWSGLRPDGTAYHEPTERMS